MKITEDVRRYAAEKGMGEDGALDAGMAEKSREFLDGGAKVYVPAGNDAGETSIPLP